MITPSWVSFGQEEKQTGMTTCLLSMSCALALSYGSSMALGLETEGGLGLELRVVLRVSPTLYWVRRVVQDYFPWQYNQHWYYRGVLAIARHETFWFSCLFSGALPPFQNRSDCTIRARCYRNLGSWIIMPLVLNEKLPFVMRADPNLVFDESGGRSIVHAQQQWLHRKKSIAVQKHGDSPTNGKNLPTQLERWWARWCAYCHYCRASNMNIHHTE